MSTFRVTLAHGHIETVFIVSASSATEAKAIVRASVTGYRDEDSCSVTPFETAQPIELYTYNRVTGEMTT